MKRHLSLMLFDFKTTIIERWSNVETTIRTIYKYLLMLTLTIVNDLPIMRTMLIIANRCFIRRGNQTLHAGFSFDSDLAKKQLVISIPKNFLMKKSHFVWSVSTAFP